MLKDKLIGKFHSHITISSQYIDLAISTLKNNNIKFKHTVIELIGNKTQTDVMITQHFHTRKHHNYKNIENYVLHTAKILENANIPVIRIKIEHEDLPTLQPTAEKYRECHIKIRLPFSEHKNILLHLKNDKEFLGTFVFSRNPNEVKDDYVHHFLNSRVYSGTVEEFDKSVDIMVNKLKNIGLNVIEAKKESTILDTRLETDKWWA